MSAAEISRAQLRTQILRPVSRSFYLSIQFLPTALRDPIALAYLLARATDTIADTHQISVAIRQETLARLAAAIQNDSLGEVAWPKPDNEAERKLLEALPACFEWLRALPADDRSAVQQVLLKINGGQTLDLQRSELHTAAELDEYTYLVAGCVGEFWTRICELHLPDFANRSADEMRRLGVEYGKGLQLINILRDVGDDLRAGRCYFPVEELTVLGIAPNEVLQQPTRIVPLLEKWRAKAEQGINAGLEYSAAIRNGRVRFATALPALIGARTLKLLRAAGAEALRTRIKISRGEVRKIILATTIRRASPKFLRAEISRR